MNDATFVGKLPNGSIRNKAPLASWRLSLLPSVIGPQRKMPAGTTMVPPPAVVQALMAFWMAVVFVVMPSPTALNGESVMVKVRLGMMGSGTVCASAGKSPAQQLSNNRHHRKNCPRRLQPVRH